MPAKPQVRYGHGRTEEIGKLNLCSQADQARALATLYLLTMWRNALRSGLRLHEACLQGLQATRPQGRLLCFLHMEGDVQVENGQRHFLLQLSGELHIKAKVFH